MTLLPLLFPFVITFGFVGWILYFTNRHYLRNERVFSATFVNYRAIHNELSRLAQRFEDRRMRLEELKIRRDSNITVPQKIFENASLQAKQADDDFTKVRNIACERGFDFPEGHRSYLLVR